MSDQEVRQLERLNATNSTDLDVSQKLLASYVRAGVLTRGDILDLAALGDLGAIGFVGKTPDLSSRNKRFYIRCAWICLREVVKNLNPIDFNDYAALIAGQTHFLPQALRNTYSDAFKIITECDRVVEIFLNKAASTKEILELTERLGWKFESLRKFLYNADLSSSNTAERNHETLSWILNGYHSLCEAFEETTKKNTDDAIYSAGIALDCFHGLSYQQALSAPPRGHRIPADYFTEHAREVLADNRVEIVRQWLPNYTPMFK